ncbi:LolA family protein [Pseudonocardia nantongensis]|uniref:LolA family protein n=1 Tax=Pseudonocardia nantongensis TaxID=1181885 RepID=UPI00397861BE
MSSHRLRTGGIAAALAAALAVTLTFGLVTARGASAAQELPPVSPEELIASVAEAEPAALAGTLAVENRLGLPALPGGGGQPGLTDGTSTARVWSDGEGRGRLALPRPDGERTYVDDGATRWAYDSADRTVTKLPARGPDAEHRRDVTDPQQAAAEAVQKLRSTSTVTVDGTTEVDGRPAYTLVLAPQPGERTLLRQVRVAVDAQTRTPLELAVLAGEPEPVLRIGFDDVTFGPQDPSLFTFTPPPGATVQDAPARESGDRPGRGQDGERPDAPVVGDGWDAVLTGTVPERAQEQPGEQAPDLSELGTPVSGPWGTGRQLSSPAGTAILTDDGRFAAGAVGPDVLGAALAR